MGRHHVRFTEEQTEIVRQHYGIPSKKIIELFPDKFKGRSSRSIDWIRQKNGLVRQPQKCWYPVCSQMQLSVSCDEHRKCRAAWQCRISRDRIEGKPETTPEEFIQIYKERNGYSVDGVHYDMDPRPADITWTCGKTSPCAQCWAGSGDKNRFGCVECVERVKYAVAVERYVL